MYIRKDIKDFLSSSPEFEQMMALAGEAFRHQDGRLTQRVNLDNKYYFIKQHDGVGWKEIFKNLLQLRLPVLSAKNEWLALEKLRSLGLNVPVVAAYGLRGTNPAKLKSFVLMEEVAPVISLEDLAKDWLISPPSLRLKRRLIGEVARIARVMHQNGMNHRDFYICHFLLDISHGRANIDADSLKLFLIDLHRAQIRRSTPERWIIKDLAGLYFSGKDIGLTQRDLLYFMKIYSAKSLRELMVSENEFWQKVKVRGCKYRDRTR